MEVFTTSQYLLEIAAVTKDWRYPDDIKISYPENIDPENSNRLA